MMEEGGICQASSQASSAGGSQLQCRLRVNSMQGFAGVCVCDLFSEWLKARCGTTQLVLPGMQNTAPCRRSQLPVELGSEKIGEPKKNCAPGGTGLRGETGVVGIISGGSRGE
eukprot:RCo010489